MLQVCAWTGMIARFSQNAPMTEAVSKALDSQHPCRMCHWVRKGRADERNKADSVRTTRFEGIPITAPLVWTPWNPEGQEPPSSVHFLRSRILPAPPVPPPRYFLAI